MAFEFVLGFQTVACIGQQTVGGERIPIGGMMGPNSTGCFRGRTLPHFRKYDQSPAGQFIYLTILQFIPKKLFLVFKVWTIFKIYTKKLIV